MDGDFQTGRNFIYGLVTIFGLVIIALVIIPIFKSHLYPAFDQYLGDSTISADQKAVVADGWTSTRFMISTSLVVTFIVVVIYLFIVAFRKERQEQNY